MPCLAPVTEVVLCMLILPGLRDAKVERKSQKIDKARGREGGEVSGCGERERDKARNRDIKNSTRWLSG